MRAKRSRIRLALPQIYIVIGCLLLGLAASALLFSPSPRNQRDERAVSAQLPSAGLRLMKADGSRTSAVTRERLMTTYVSLPLTFEANQGQTDPQVKYLARGNGYTLFLTSGEAVLSMPGPTAASHNVTGRRSKQSEQPRAAVLRIQMVGARPHSEIAGNELQQGVSSYFISSDPRNWHTGVPHYARVTYKDVYPGVNLAYHGEKQHLEFDFILAAGASPVPIDVHFTGAKSLSTDASGDLVLSSAAGDMRVHKPVAYQEQDGARRLVDAKFVVEGRNRIRFALGNYDHSRELVIDPSLSYSTYLGGGAEDKGTSIALDSSGNAYVAGEAGDTSFPHTSGSFSGGAHDAFVTKLNPSGAQVYSTFIGGTQDDAGLGIAVDGSGNAYVVGNTQASSSFPATTTIGSTGGQDAFVAKLDSSGVPAYATVLAGSGTESGNAIAVDSAGSVYVAGETDSANFPTLNPIPGGNLNSGGKDGFVAQLNISGTALVYSTYLGGNSNDTPTGIVLDSINDAYVTGVTLSATFPTTLNALQGSCASCPGSDDAFVTEFSPAGSLIYSTYLGGAGTDDGEAIAVDATGAAYVTGKTDSNPFPAAGTPAQGTFGGGTSDAFVAKVNPNGTSLAFTTYLGGSGSDEGFGIALDNSNNVYVTGKTDSSDFPHANGLFTALSGTSDAFVTELAASGSSFTFSTYFGGTGNEDTLSGAIALDASGNIYISGDTNSSSGFPLVSASQGTFGGGLADAFVAKISPAAGTPTFTVGVSPGTATITSGQTTSAFTITVTPQNGFNSDVALSCSTLPTGAACHFTPASVTGGSGTSQLTISTTTHTTGLLAPRGNDRQGLFYALLVPPGLALAGAGFGRNPSRKSKLMAFMLGCMVFSGLAFTAACGSGSSPPPPGSHGTPPGTYNVTVKGTAGSTVVNGTPVIVLTVQ